MADVDSLNISISASATKASKSIDLLVKKLDALSDGLGSIQGAKLKSLASGAESLGKAVSSLKGTDAKEYTRIANAFKKFGDIDTSKFDSISSGLLKLSVGMKALGNVQDLSGLSSVINAVKNLSKTDMGGFDATKFAVIADSVSDFASKMSTVGEIDSKVTRLVGSMARLASSGQYIGQVAENFPTLSKSVENFARNMSRISGADANITKLVDGIARLASAGNKTAETAKNLDNLGNAVLRLLNNLKNAPQLNANLANTIQGLGNLAQSGGRVSSVTNTASNTTSRFGNSLKGLKDRFTSAAKSSKGLVSQIGMFYAKMFLVIRAIKSLGKSVKSSMDYIETLNYFNAGFGQVADNADLKSYAKMGYESAEEYYNSFSKRAEQLTQKMSGYKILENGMAESTDMKSLGVDPSLVMQYQTQFAQMSSSMGVASETALQLSSTLTRLGADLASVKNLDFADVWEDMSSGLVGMSRTLDKYGTNIRNVNLQQKAQELGISTSVAKMNQQNKALLRTIILLDSTRYAWGDMSDTIEQPANQLRLLQNSWNNLSRTIGNIFLPIVAKLLPYLNALVIVLQKAAQAIVNLLGFKDFDWGGASGTGSNSFDFGDALDDSDGIAENMDKTAKKAKKASDNLQGFDIINKLQEKDTSDTGSGAAPDTSFGDLGKMEDALAKLTKEYDIAWAKAFKEMENKAESLAKTIQDKIVGAFKKLKQVAEPTLRAIKKLWDEGLGKLAKFSFENLESFYNNFLKPIGEWFLGDESGLPKFFEITNDLLNEIDWEKIQGSLDKFYKALQKPTKFVWTALMDFYESFLKPIATWTFSDAIPKLTDAFTLLINRIDWKGANSTFRSIFTFLSTVLKDIASVVVNIASKLLPKISPIINDIMSILKKLIDNVLMPLWNVYKKYILPILEGIATALGETILSQIKIFTSGLRDALGGFIDFFTGIFTGDFSKAWSGIVTIQKTYLGVIKDTIENIVGGWKGIFSAALNGIKKIWGGIASWFGNVWSDIKKSFSGIGSWFKEKFGGAYNSVKAVWNVAKTFFGIVWSGIKEVFSGVKGWFGERFSGAYEKIKDAFSGIKKFFENRWADIKNAFSGVVNWFKDTFGGGKDGAWGKVKEAWNGAKSFFGGIFGDIKDAAKSPLNGLLGFFESLFNSIIDAFNAIKKQLNKFSIKIPDWVPKIGGEKFGFDLEESKHIEIKRFATGGFPEDGWFRANRGEIMGRFDNGKSVVANNEQITDGIAKAVAPAVYSAVKAAMNDMDLGDKEIVINLDGKTIARNSVGHINSMTRSAGRSPILGIS
jgi:phage-related protein